MGMLSLIEEANKEQRPGQTLDQRQLLHLGDKPGQAKRDPCGTRTLTSPFGNITMKVTDPDAVVRCPISGAYIQSDGIGVTVKMPRERESLMRSRRIVAKTEVDVLISHLRSTHGINDNTNERRMPPPKGNKA